MWCLSEPLDLGEPLLLLGGGEIEMLYMEEDGVERGGRRGRKR